MCGWPATRSTMTAAAPTIATQKGCPMSAQDITFSVFTKPWKTPLPELGKVVGDLGFDGVELPVRPGFQVEPENVSRGLPEAARTLAEFGVKISSVAANPSEAIIAACGELQIPLL